MKTEGLTFLEAVQALVDGKCKKIKSCKGTIFSFNEVGILSHFGGIDNGVKLRASSFLSEWSLIGVEQKVVIDNVIFRKDHQDSAVYPCGAFNNEWDCLLNKPPMKMTLEWEE